MPRPCACRLSRCPRGSATGSINFCEELPILAQEGRKQDEAGYFAGVHALMKKGGETAHGNTDQPDLPVPVVHGPAR